MPKKNQTPKEHHTHMLYPTQLNGLSISYTCPNCGHTHRGWVQPSGITIRCQEDYTPQVDAHLICNYCLRGCTIPLESGIHFNHPIL